ncbi:MAG: pyridoxal-phosphate dependent enzyme [Thermotogae bacterium]|nr:pyridoxal-phosphate dependent enzyme [Thermotogota bacterium]
MLHPDKIDPGIRQMAQKKFKEDPLDPINLFNITWRDPDNRIEYMVLPKELTGVDANIIVMYSRDFPTGSHKVGATYSILVEKVIRDEVDPSYHTLIWPSTGNYGIGGAWVGCRMKFDTIVILPEEMSKERFDMIRSYGARVIATPGCESNVKEIYDKSKELKAQNPDKVRILNQFSEFGNYRFHYYVTGNTMLELVEQEEIGNGKIDAVVLGVGSAGTIACGDRVKQVFPDAKVVALEPIQCPTISMNGYGGHDIQGIGDKHVTWIHHVTNNDAVVAIDDMESKKGLQLLTDEVGKAFLKEFIPEKTVEEMSTIFGISGVANVLGAIKIAKKYGFGKDDNILTIATDTIDRYRSVMSALNKKFGKMDRAEAKARFESIFMGVKTDWFFEGTLENRRRWHNLKYYTWVEQQGKTVEELNEQLKEEYWEKQQQMTKETDELILDYRKKEG